MTARTGRSLRVAWRFLAVIGAVIFGCGAAAAENGRPVYLPLAFDAEGQPLQTTACLLVTERVYSPSPWWMDPTRNADASERALKAVVAAIRRKDRAALYQLSHPTLGRDPKRFDEQAGAFFRQFAAIDLVAVPRAYEVNGLTVFFAKFRFKETTAFAPLIFAIEDDGSAGFLPYRTDALTYRLVEDWFKSGWGPTRTENPAYCSNVDIKRATHRIFLGPSPGTARPPQPPSPLFLRGASFERPGELSALASRIRSSIASLNSALVRGSVDAIAAHLTPEGARRLKEWFVTADQNERQRYATAIAGQQPFFMFDLTSVAVVYMRSPTGVQVMYFTANPDGAPLWVNSSHITVLDQVFKKDPLRAAASQGVPFSNVTIR